MVKGSALIVGASGFLGLYLARLCQARWNLLAVDSKPPLEPWRWSGHAGGRAESVDWAGLVGDRKIEVCFFLAGSASVPASVAQPFADFGALLPGLASVLGYLGREHPGCRVVLFSSAAVYGNPDVLPVSEAFKVQPVSPYGAHKILAEEMVRLYTGLFPISGRILRIFSAYGEGLRRQLLWDVLLKRETALAEGKKAVRLWGTGKETRDFVHGEDVAHAAVLAALAGESIFEVFNVASGIETRIEDVAQALLGNLLPRTEVEFGGENRSGDPIHWRADVTALKNLGWSPRVAIDDGLRRYQAWFEEVRKTAG